MSETRYEYDFSTGTTSAFGVGGVVALKTPKFETFTKIDELTGQPEQITRAIQEWYPQSDRHIHLHYHAAAAISPEVTAPAEQQVRDDVQVKVQVSDVTMVALPVVLRSASFLILFFSCTCVIGNLTGRRIILDPIVCVALVMTSVTFFVMSFGSRSKPPSASTDLAVR
ncbi:hypothetical protein [uncultured Sphingomonas sp.]|uniref:hypothetical protein n=1 Tax=uncultured Sphingomonas sp. TaxID=158754 RepID=UPI00374A92A1